VLAGWMIGTILVFASRVWSRRDKLIGALLLLLPILVLSVPFVAASAGGENAMPPGETGPAGEKVEDPSLGPGPTELYLLVAGLPSALYLGWRLRRGDPATSPKESRNAGHSLTVVVLRCAERARSCRSDLLERGSRDRAPKQRPGSASRSTYGRSAQMQRAAIHQRYCLDRMTLRRSAAGIRWL
jgi:hypothetical protein